MENNEKAAEGFIKGEIIFTIYENTDNHFSILKIKIHETNESIEDKEIVLKGYFTNLQKGVLYLFNGKLDRHPRFGMQYDVTSYQTFLFPKLLMLSLLIFPVIYLLVLARRPQKQLCIILVKMR